MKKILILIVVLGGLVGTAVVYQKQQDAALNTAASRGTKTRTLLLPGLNVSDVRKVRIKDSKGEVNLNIDADRKGATIAEREGYPASGDRINSSLSELHGLPIASKLQIGKSAWAKSNLQPPGDGAVGVGSQVELIGDGDKVVASFILGDSISSAGGRNASQFSSGSTQRLVRVPEDGETVWVINSSLAELQAKPEEWLDKAFFDVQEIKEITVQPVKAEEAWKVGRKSAADNYALLDAKTGEGLDVSKVPFANLLSNIIFTDVVVKSKVAELMKDAVKVKIVNFTGFVYDIQLKKVAKDGSDRYYLTVNVSSNLPATRPAVKDEKEEDKKKADEAFASQKKAADEKLAREQKLAGWAFEVSEYTINGLFKLRSEIVKVDAEAKDVPPQAPAGGAASLVPSLSAPAAPIRAATPPVQVPAAPAPEAAPAPAAPQN